MSKTYKREAVPKLVKQVEILTQALMAIEGHGCLTGDCPHWFQQECYVALPDIKEIAEIALKESKQLCQKQG